MFYYCYAYHVSQLVRFSAGSMTCFLPICLWNRSGRGTFKLWKEMTHNPVITLSKLNNEWNHSLIVARTELKTYTRYIGFWEGSGTCLFRSVNSSLFCSSKHQRTRSKARLDSICNVLAVFNQQAVTCHGNTRKIPECCIEIFFSAIWITSVAVLHAADMKKTKVTREEKEWVLELQMIIICRIVKSCYRLLEISHHRGAWVRRIIVQQRWKEYGTCKSVYVVGNWLWNLRASRRWLSSLIHILIDRLEVHPMISSNICARIDSIVESIHFGVRRDMPSWPYRE